MKTVTYSISKEEISKVKKDANKELNRLIKAFTRNPEHYRSSQAELMPEWRVMAQNKARFQQLTRDELASIDECDDDFYSFADHAADMYNAAANPDIDPKELKAQEKRERARFNRAGRFFYELIVLGETEDAISGFVGKDFYGSGYDDEMYRTAIEKVEEVHPAYIKQLTAITL